MKFMGLLFKRYASPFLLLDGYIATGRFYEFVVEFINNENESNMWEFYLHKVEGKSFEEFKQSVKNFNNNVSDEQIETTITNSKNIMKGFVPERG